MSKLLFESTDPRFKTWIGKKVTFTDKHGKQHVGTLDFAGINSKLHNQFQVTINRTPHWPVDPDTLKKV